VKKIFRRVDIAAWLIYDNPEMRHTVEPGYGRHADIVFEDSGQLEESLKRYQEGAPVNVKRFCEIQNDLKAELYSFGRST
jgi:hypothetical protein